MATIRPAQIRPDAARYRELWDTITAAELARRTYNRRRPAASMNGQISPVANLGVDHALHRRQDDITAQAQKSPARRNQAA